MNTNKKYFIETCQKLIKAFENGDLGQTEMPENSHPNFMSREEKLSYFTLPMALNYQRNSYDLWKAALNTWEDPETMDVFNINKAAKMSEPGIREKLIKHKVALQPNKHIQTWYTIAKTVSSEWGSFEELIQESNFDYLKLQQLIQKDFKKGFPYLSGPKIFNYWCYIITLYCDIALKNTDFIEIAPDTHITKCSVKLGVITEKESETLSKEQISAIWRELLSESGINPIDMHAPLWFWSRNGFLFELN